MVIIRAGIMAPPKLNLHPQPALILNVKWLTTLAKRPTVMDKKPFQEGRVGQTEIICQFNDPIKSSNFSFVGKYS